MPAPSRSHPTTPPEQADRLFKRDQHSLALLLPERPLEGLPGGAVLGAALNRDVLHVPGEPEGVQDEPGGDREREGEHGVHGGRDGPEEHEQQSQDRRIQDGRRQKERDRPGERRTASEQAHENGNGRARAERGDRAERRSQKRVGRLMRPCEEALDTLFRDIDLQQGDEKADAYEEGEQLAEEHQERLPGRDEG